MPASLLALLCASAFAQDPAEGPAPLMQLDSLLVAPVRAPAERRADAERLTRYLLGELESSWDVARVEDAPPFLDYDARTYMEACPEGRYAGCALVVGQRMELDWAIATELTPRGDGDHLQVTFVDLRGSQEVFSIGLTVAAEREEAVMRSVAALLERVVAGAFEAPDIRELPAEDPEATRRREAERAARIAANLDQLEEELGDVEIADVERLEPVKLEMADLERYRGAEGVKPWEQAGITERQFVRYKNSGLDLQTWRRRAAGRAGMVLLRAEVGGGRGASAESYHGWVALGDDLAVRETDALLEARNAPQFTAGAELGLGVLPWLELGGGLWSQTGTFTYLIDQDVEDDPVQIPSVPLTQTMGSVRYGGGATVAPLPAKDARPTFTVQLSRWTGKGFTPPDERLRRLPAPALTILEPAVGGEVRASAHATLQARLGLSVPVGGTASYRDTAGDSSLPTVIVPSGDPGVGWSLRVGVQARLGPLWGGEMIAWVTAAYADEMPADLLRLRQPLAEVHFTKVVSTVPDRPPVLRGRGRSGPITAWVWPDGTVARWRRATGRGTWEEHWYDPGGIPALTVRWIGSAPSSASVASFPPTEVDLAGWTGAPVGPATVVGPGVGAVSDDGTWWTSPAGILGAYWVEQPVDPADGAFGAALAEGCGCLLADRTTALAGTVAGVRWTLRAPHPQSPAIGELWAFPRANGVLVVSWSARETVDPGRPELGPGRVASALVTWGAP